ncbi:unnamed protein product [Polarella glacialis]|uniref:Uncharacterized protein n=1 Tax=Polarella glacialis TaxID=89957 RepID=A0A813GQF9_POLGL|nr:unnamed protein product [Polarella glacialis]
MAGGAAATSEGSAASAAALQWTVPEPEMSKLKSRRPRAVPSTSPPSKVQVPSTAARAPKPMDSAEVIRSLQVWQKAVSYVDGWVQKYPDWMQDTVAPAMMAILVLMVVRDAAYNSLGSSNGKFISFVDTCLSVMSYRDGLPNKKGKYFVGGDGQAAFGFRVVTGSFCMKFASGIAVSALIGKTPVVFKSIRHSLFVALGLVLLWLTPGDYAYTMMKKSHALRLVLLAGGGLYKLRKAVYAIEVIIESGGGFSLALASVVPW